MIELKLSYAEMVCIRELLKKELWGLWIGFRKNIIKGTSKESIKEAYTKFMTKPPGWDRLGSPRECYTNLLSLIADEEKKAQKVLKVK